MKQKQRGFTLIELLVVIAIIGILASVVLSSLSSARAGARDAKRLAEVRQLQTSLEMFYNANSRYPLDSMDRGANSSYYMSIITPDLVPQYMPSLPPNAEYRYGSSSNGSMYTILVRLERNSNWCEVDSPAGDPHWPHPNCN